FDEATDRDEPDAEMARSRWREYTRLRGQTTRGIELRAIDSEGRPLAGVPASVISIQPLGQLCGRTDQDGRVRLSVGSKQQTVQFALGGGRWARRVEKVRLVELNSAFERVLESAGTITTVLDGDHDVAPEWTIEAWSAKE